jgi:hypothetical protein
MGQHRSRLSGPGWLLSPESPNPTRIAWRRGSFFGHFPSSLHQLGKVTAGPLRYPKISCHRLRMAK